MAKNKSKRDERWALDVIAVIAGKLMRDAENKNVMTKAQILAYGDEIQSVLLCVEAPRSEGR